MAKKKKKNNKGRTFKLLLFLILILIVLSYFINKQYTNKKNIKQVDNMIAKQVELEKKIIILL